MAGQQKVISSTFNVSTVDETVSLQAQYAPNDNPTSSQIHNTWQEGDLYMRTKMTNETTWSDWHRIVGEGGDETDYTFAISQYKTTSSPTTAPSDISSSDWQDAPLAVTSSKPYLWSRVQKKVWNDALQDYVVDSTRYIRLNGEDGDDGVSYIIESTVGSITIASNKTSESISNVVFSFYKKEGDNQRVAYQCYCTVFRKKGSTYTMVRKYTTAGAAVTYSNDNITVANYDAIVVCIYNESSESHSGYLAEYQIPVWKHGDEPYFADINNEMDSIACDNIGHPSSEQTVSTNVALYKGSTKLSPTISVKDDNESGSSYTSGVAKNYITVTWNNATGDISFKFATGATLPESKAFCIIVSATDLGSTVTKSLYFTINGIRAAKDGDPAVLYRLVTRPDQIVKKNDNTYVPAANTYVTCGVTKNVGGTESTPLSTEYSLSYILNETGDEKSDYTDTKIKVQDVTKNVVFILRVGGVVVDRETIPIVSDGANGTDGTDAQDAEWAFIRTTTNVPPVINDDTTYIDHNDKDYTSDGHLPRVTASSNTENNYNRYECTANPKGINDTWKYEWEIKRTKGNAVNGKRNWQPYIGTMTLRNNYAQSAFIIDLSNDNDQFGTDGDGKVLVEQVRSTTVTVYDGSTPQTLSSLLVNLTYEDNTVVPTTGSNAVATYTANPATGVVAITILQNTTTAFSHSEIKAAITASVEGKGTKQAVFTVRKVMSGQPGLSPVIYQLNPTNKSFIFNRGTDNALTPPSRSTTINSLKTVGNTTTPASAEDSLTFSWGYDTDTTAQESNVLIGNDITISNSQAAAHYQIWVLLSTGDRETLPIVKDGQNGDDGVSYCFVFTKASASVNENNIVSAELAGYAYKYVGDVRSALTNTTIRYGYILTDSGTYADTTTDSSGFFDAGTWFNGDDITDPQMGKNSPSIFAAIVIGGTVVHAEMITISKKGSTGSRGKVGRFFYYATEWDATDNSQKWSATDAEAPYFKVGSSYYVYIGENNFTNKTMYWINTNYGAPSPNNANFKIMYNEWKYIITEAIFGIYSHLGSFIINGDWMISQHGKKNNVDSTDYQSFDQNFAKGCYLCQGVDVNVNSKLVGSNVFIGGKTYTITLIGEDFYADSGVSSQKILNVRMYNGSSNIGSTINLTPANPTQTLTFTPPSTGLYYVRVDMQSGGTYGMLTAYVNNVFIPNFAIDALQGTSYQRDAYLSGILESEDIDMGNKISIDAKNGAISMIGPTSINDDDHTPASNKRMELFKLDFFYDADALTRYAMWKMNNGVTSKNWAYRELLADPYYGFQAQAGDDDDKHGRLSPDGVSISWGSSYGDKDVDISPEGVTIRRGSTYTTKTWEQIFNNQ